MINMGKYIPAEKLKTKIKERIEEAQSLYKPSLNPFWAGQISAFQSCLNILDSLQQEQPELPTIKGWIARDDLDRLGLYDQKPTRKTKLGAFSGIVHPWEIGDTWIGRFSLDQAAKPLFPNLCWTDDPMEVEIMFKPIQEQPVEWSEEDERKSLEIKCLIGNYRTGNDEYKLCSWIDKIKDRIQHRKETVN